MNATLRKETDADVLCWRAYPARDRPAAAGSALAVMLLMAVLSAALMQSALWGGIALAVQGAALRRFFLPSEYRIDDEGISASLLWSRRHYRWHEVRRFHCDARGGFLSTRRQSSLLDLFRGMHLVFAGNREAIVDRIRSRMTYDVECGL